MPVILKLTEYEAGLVVDALANGRASLMKQWGSVFEQEVYDDGVLLLSKDSILENLDDNIAALAWVRKRLERAVVDTPPEGGKLDAVWHHKRGWIHPVDEIRKAAMAVASDEFTREEVANVLGEGAAQDQIAPGSWITLPDGYEVDADPYEVTDPEELITAGVAVDTQADAARRVKVTILLGDKTTTFEAVPLVAAQLVKDLDLA